MKRQAILVGSLLTALSVIGCGCSAPAPAPAPETAQAQDVPLPAPQPRHPTLAPGGSVGGFEGKVTKIGPDWFEVGAGWDGELHARAKHNDGNDKPVKAFVGGTLVAGDPNGIGIPGCETYHLKDLKVGDVVSVNTSVTPDRQQFAVSAMILRRPGGTIPPLPLGRQGCPSEAVDRNRAEQDWEEKGIAIPKKFRDGDGRYTRTDPPYPPVAPMPRPAVPLKP